MSGKKPQKGTASDSTDHAVPQTFVPEGIAAKRASLMPITLHRWLEKAQTPNGWGLVVQQDLASREFSLDEESVRKLESRFVYAGSGKPAGPRTFSPYPPSFFPRSRFTNNDSKLMPFPEALASFRNQFGWRASETLRKWCAQGHGPKKIRMPLIRDSITNKLYIGQGSLSAAQSIFAMNR